MTRERSLSGTPGPSSSTSRYTRNAPEGTSRCPQRMVTTPPAGVYLMALSTRLDINSRSSQPWPVTCTGCTSSPRSSPLPVAASRKFSSSVSHRSFRSTRCSGCASMLRSSARDKASSWCASCEVRRVALRSFSICSTPKTIAPCALWAGARGCFLSKLAESPCTAPAALAIIAQASTCACRPASGVRNWWAASATNRRCPSACALTRANRRLSECTSGRTSVGEALSSMGLRSRGERCSTASARSTNGLKARPTAQWMASAAAATSTRLGSSTRKSSC